MQHRRLYFLIPLILMVAAPALVAQGGAEPLSCADRSVTARAVRTTKDVKSFVQCAYEFAREVGFEKARQAFHEDERWRSGPIYVFVDEVTPISEHVSIVRLPTRPL